MGPFPPSRSKNPPEEPPTQGNLVADDDVKPRINELLFPLVSGSMTIHDFERLACDVFDLVMAARED